jgi:hypothetical protein
MKRLIWIVIIGIVCLAGCTLSGLDLKLDNASTDEAKLAE